MKSDRVGEAAERITLAAVRSSATKMVSAGSLLCVVRSGILKHTFPVAIAECDLTLNQDMRALTPAAGVDANYVRLFLTFNNDAILHGCAKDGTTVASINPDQLAAISVPLAPVAEQARIAKEAKRLLTELDEAEAALTRARRSLADYRASLLHAACIGQLTAAWRASRPDPAEDGPALLRRILAERQAAWERAELARLHARGTAPTGDGWKARYQESVGSNVDGLLTLPGGWT
jgi:type I restriction enzyme, S subunit